MKEKSLLIITYCIYITMYESLIIGGCGYIIFWVHRSHLWIFLAILFSSAAYSPKRWHQLVNEDEDED